MARPKEPGRKHVHVTLLEGTIMKLDKQIRLGDQKRNSRGKVIDRLAAKSIR
jgi:hypothetical protein